MRLLEDTSSLRRFVLRRVLIPDENHQLYTRGVIVIILGCEQGLGASEQLIHREGFSRRRCIRQEKLIEIDGGLRSRQLTKCEVPLYASRASLYQRTDYARSCTHDSKRS